MTSIHFSYLIFFFFFLIPLTPQAKCPDRCGKIDIEYPFGIGPGCYLDEPFQIDCNNTFNPPKALLRNQNQSEVIRIQIPESQVWVNYPYLAQGCFPTDKSIDDYNATIASKDIDINLSSPYALSDRNSITVLGCDDFVRINDGDSDDVVSGCTAICLENRMTGICPKDASSGNGCCQSPVPGGMTQLSFNFTDMHEHSRGYSGKRLFNCSYAFIGEKANNSFSYDLRGLNNNGEFQTDNPQATASPLVLDWWIGNQSCVESTSVVCKKNSHCQNVSYGQEIKGYTCHCNVGYEGNPYVPGGCTDINECSSDNKNDCISSTHCKNTEGSFLCVCPRGHTGNGKKNGDGCSPSTLLNIITGVGSGIGFMLLLTICYWLYTIFQRTRDEKRKQEFFMRNGGLLLQQQESRGDVLGKMNLFTSNELEKATDSFNEARIIGQGGHGMVYKGILSDGKIVAIKKAKLLDETQKEQFINEMIILSQINHKHVVKLLGCCLETEVPLLVYEFVPNGTLFSLIHDPSIEFPLTWSMRLKIAADVAGAIAYLHSSSSVPIYHRDIKSNNILMDEKRVAKVSDFGASRLVPVDQTHLTTVVAGTFGYLDPEYFQSSQLTEKSDVYSFGVVLVELLTGKRPISFNREDEERSLATHFLVAMENKNIESIFDDEVVKAESVEDALKVARLAKRCLNLKGKSRPTMKVVAMELENIMKSKMGPVCDDEDVMRGDEPKLMTLSSFDYTWTWAGSSNSLPNSPKNISHPLINDKC